MIKLSVLKIVCNGNDFIFSKHAYSIFKLYVYGVILEPSELKARSNLGYATISNRDREKKKDEDSKEIEKWNKMYNKREEKMSL